MIEMGLFGITCICPVIYGYLVFKHSRSETFDESKKYYGRIQILRIFFWIICVIQLISRLQP